MSVPLEPLTVLLEPVSRLIDLLRARERKKEIREQALEYLEDDFKRYSESFTLMAKISNEELIPLLDSIEIGPTRFQRKQFIILIGKIQNSFSWFVASFANLAKSCKLVSLNPAFMDELKESKQRFLYDFLVQMTAMVKSNNLIVIDESFYAFLKLYKKEWGKGLKFSEKESNEMTKKAKTYIKKINSVMVPAIQRMRSRERVSQIIKKQMQPLPMPSAKVRAEPTNISFVSYFPPELKPIMGLLEELPNIKI